MGEERTCGSCCWYEGYCGVCCNGRSEHRAEFMDEDDTCSKWSWEYEEEHI